MVDTYQAIYDAVRSRISGGDISGTVRDVLFQAFDIGHAKQMLQQEIYAVAYEMRRPSAVFKPTLSADGSQWCALLGEDLQRGVAGFGDTPEAAMAAFDQAFWKGRTPAAIRLAKAEQVPA